MKPVIAFVVGLFLYLAVTFTASVLMITRAVGAECHPPQIGTADLLQQGAAIGVVGKKMDGPEMKALSSVLKSSLGDHMALEPETDAVYIFDLPTGASVVFEFTGDCSTASFAIPTTLLHIMLDKMSANALPDGGRATN